MTTLAWYAPEDRIIDLGRLTPADYETITALQGQIRRSDRILLCTRPGADPEMLIWSRGGRFWARHFPGGGHGPHLIALMSPEHIRATDYAIRAAEDAGYTTVPEAVTDNRTRLDAVIYGPGVSQVTGIEVQATAITKRTVLARTTRSSRATALKGACAQPLPRGVLPL